MEIIAYLVFGCFILFLIIMGAVKMAVSEALKEFKEEIVKEFKAQGIQVKSSVDDE